MPGPPSPIPQPSAPQPSMPQPAHVVIVMEENHSLPQVIGNPVMPFLNQLASANALATRYFADTHSSLPNYFMLTTGQLITTTDAFSGVVTADNIVRELVAAGETWKGYFESLPSVGYLGPDVSPYVKRHNPFAYFSDVINTAQANNIVPFTEFSGDLAAGQLPNFAFVVPNVLDDAHNCPIAGQTTCTDNDKLSAADAWLQRNLAPLLSDPNFQNSGLFIVVFDEGQTSDVQGGGGNVAIVMVGTGVKKGFQSTVMHDHAALLRTVLELLGINVFPGAANSVADLGEFF